MVGLADQSLPFRGLTEFIKANVIQTLRLAGLVTKVPTIGESSRPTTVEAFGTVSKQEDAAEGGRGG